MRTIHLIEHEWLGFGPGAQGMGKSLQPVDVDHLFRLEPTLPRGAVTWRRDSLKIGQYCGVLRLGDLVLEVLPKLSGFETQPGLARKVLIKMLRMVGDTPLTDTGPTDVDVQRHHLLDIFIAQFCASVNNALRRGPIREYRRHESNLRAVRGRIDLTQQVRLNLFHRERVYCSYDELDVDNAHNQALKCCLRVLLRWSDGADVKGLVNELLRRLDDVRDVRMGPGDVKKLYFDRTNLRWRPVFRAVERFLGLEFPDVWSGPAESTGLLFDMNRLFEAFVAHVIVKEFAGTDCTVRVQGPRRPHYFGTLAPGTPIVRLVPDVLLEDRLGNHILVLDAKWKVFESGKVEKDISVGDLYQIATYAQRFGCPRVILTYPAQAALSATSPRTISVESTGARITLLGIDLAASTADCGLGKAIRGILGSDAAARAHQAA